MNILIVEDEKLYRDEFKEILLELYGEAVHIKQAISEKGARKLTFNSGNFNLVIIDLHLPEDDYETFKDWKYGKNLIKFLESQRSKNEEKMPTYIIALTQYGNEQMNEMIVSVGADAYMDKGDYEIMKEKMRKILLKLGLISP